MDPVIRTAMGQRFRYDFSRVRVHTDRTAAQSARSVGARAYTVGTDVVFGPGEYAPDQREGRRLLAHELAHVVQADPRRVPVGGDAERDAARASDALLSVRESVPVAASVRTGALLRQQAAESPSRAQPGGQEAAPAEVPAPPTPFARHLRLLEQALERPEILAGEPAALPPLRLDVLGEPEVDAAVEALLDALAPLIGTPEAGKVWEKVVRQVRNPRTDRKETPRLLYDEVTVRVLQRLVPEPARPDKGMSEEDRKAANRRRGLVLRRVLTSLLARAEVRLGAGRDGVGDPEREWNEVLTPASRGYFDGKADADKYTTFQQVRPALLQAFGALTDGTAAALPRMNSFYAKLVTAPFMGKMPVVHRTMAESLHRAADLLTRAERGVVAKQVKSIYDTTIRANVNNPLVLSEHSFGAAIDINAELNPNVPDFPLRFVEEVTGVPLLVTPEGREKKDLFDLGTVVDRLLFGLEDPALREIERLSGASRALVDIFRDDTTLASGLVRVTRRMGARIATGVTPERVLAAARAARTERGAVLWRYADPKVPSRARYGSAHDALADLLLPPGPGATLPESPEVWRNSRHTVELIIQMVDVYERSLTHGGGRRQPPGTVGRIEPTARAPGGEAALPQLVSSGFLNLPVRLISALRTPGGGDLTWLGSTEKEHATRDFMHFELRHRPNLVSP